MDTNKRRALVESLIRDDKYVEALKECTYLFMDAPNDPVVLQLSLFLFTRIQQGNLDYMPESAEEFLMRGIARFYNRDFKGSIEDYDRAIHLNPLMHYALKSKAFSMRFIPDLKASIVVLEQAIAIHPAGEYFDDIAEVYSMMGKLQEAIPFHEKAVEYSPNDARLWYNYGTHMGQLGNYEKAVQLFDKALVLWPQYPDALHNKQYYEQYL